MYNDRKRPSLRKQLISFPVEDGFQPRNHINLSSLDLERGGCDIATTYQLLSGWL